jgi:hypothetical protein
VHNTAECYHPVINLGIMSHLVSAFLLTAGPYLIKCRVFAPGDKKWV